MHQRLKGSLQLFRQVSPFTNTSGAQLYRCYAAQPQEAPEDDSIEVIVDGQPVRVPKGSNVLQACEAGGVDIPRYV